MTTNENSLQEIGKSAYESIAAMVAALDCDYDRLEELRDERDSWVANDDGDEDEQNRMAAEWVSEFPDDAAELDELEEAAGDCKDQDEAREAIEQDPLSLEFRSGWTTDKNNLKAEEFRLLLSTGGPATQIVGELDEYGEPCEAKLQARDWFTPWTTYTDADEDVLLAYCRCFYMDE